MTSSTARRPRRRSLILWSVSLLLLCAVGATAARHIHHEDAVRAANSAAAVDDAAAPKIHALGRLEPAGTVIQLAPPSGNEGARVELLKVAEGDSVLAGDVLAVLDNHDRRATTLAEAEARLAAAAARLAQTEAGAKAGEIAAQSSAVDMMAEQIKVAKRELKRAQELHARDVVTTEDLDAKQWAVDRAVIDLRRNEQLLVSVREVREVDVEVARQEVAIARAAVKHAAAELAATEVRAPSGGRILKIHTRLGERISDSGILELGDVDHMEAVAEVFEADVLRLDAGLPATVMLDCLNETFAGEVSEVGHMVARKAVLSNDPVSDTDARVVEVRVRLQPADSLRVSRLSNARVEVSIQLPAK